MEISKRILGLAHPIRLEVIPTTSHPFDNTLSAAKLGIFVGSVTSAIIGLLMLLWWTSRRNQEQTSDVATETSTFIASTSPDKPE